MKDFYTREDIEEFIKKNNLNISIYDDFKKLVVDEKFDNQDYEKISEYTDGMFQYDDSVSYISKNNSETNLGHLIFIHYNNQGIPDGCFQESPFMSDFNDILDMVKTSINYLQNIINNQTNNESDKKIQQETSNINDLL